MLVGNKSNVVVVLWTILLFMLCVTGKPIWQQRQDGGFRTFSLLALQPCVNDNMAVPLLDISDIPVHSDFNNSKQLQHKHGDQCHQQKST